MEDFFDDIPDSVSDEQAEEKDLFEEIGLESKEDAPQRLSAKDFIRETLSEFSDEFEELEDDDDAYKAKFHEIVSRLGKEPALNEEISTLRSKIQGLEDSDPEAIYRIAAIEYNEEQISRGERKLSKEELEEILLNEDGELTPRAIKIASRAQGRYEAQLARLENEKKDFIKQAAEAPKKYQQEIKARVSTYKSDLAKHVEEFGVAGMPVKKENMAQLERSLFLEAQKLVFSPSESTLFKTIRTNPAAILDIVVKYSNDPIAVKIRERSNVKNDIDAQTKVVKRIDKNLPNMAVRTGSKKIQDIFAVIDNN